MLGYNFQEHTYSFAVTGLKRRYSRVFGSRKAANDFMYELCAKYDLKINEIWDDNHDKTYNCDKGVTFYIHRM